MKKFAIPIENGQLCSHFGHCEQFALIDVEGTTITRQKHLTPPPHEPGVFPAWLAQQGVTHIITAGMGQRAIDLFTGHNIEVCVGVEKDTPENIVRRYLEKTLEAGSNLCDH
ncbi:MAG: NifB/NifX family molybdenum-iron cluster-binding protein [Bacteroidales bacterium]|jgi:predicted Fe-Mo cluster-binding NifX family protein